MYIIHYLADPAHFLIYTWCISFIASLFMCYNKGISMLAGFIVTLALGPLSFFIMIAAKPDEQVMEERALAKNQLKRCPRCHELIRTGATKCRYCRSDVIII